MTDLSSQISNFIFLGIIVGIPLYGFFRKVKVYETFIDGAKDGFNLAVTIIPYAVAIIVAIGMLRASGALDLFAKVLAPLLSGLDLPPDVLTLALMRPISGTASNGILAEIINHFGADSFAARVAATISGSTETTFYVLAVYFGAVAIKRTRHAVIGGLTADSIGAIASVAVCWWLLKP